MTMPTVKNLIHHLNRCINIKIPAKWLNILISATHSVDVCHWLPYHQIFPAFCIAESHNAFEAAMRIRMYTKPNDINIILFTRENENKESRKPSSTIAFSIGSNKFDWWSHCPMTVITVEDQKGNKINKTKQKERKSTWAQIENQQENELLIEKDAPKTLSQQQQRAWQ